jgi:hypothetical protein
VGDNTGFVQIAIKICWFMYKKTIYRQRKRKKRYKCGAKDIGFE